MKIEKSHNHDHFWIEDGELYETYRTIRGLRYRFLMTVDMQDCDKCSDEMIEKINKLKPWK